jgi:uncharacterized protein YeeX (DUF496 family)
MENRMKKIGFIVVSFVLLLTMNSCLTMGGNSNMMSNNNALAYTDDQVNIDFAQKVWNGPIEVISELQSSGYLASYDIENINSLKIYIPYNIKDDPEYNVEVATILSYYAELYRQVQSKESISTIKAISHMKSSYDLMIDKYLIANNHDPKNIRQFKELVNNLENCDVSDSVYYFNGRPIFDNGIVTRYTN